MNFLDPEFAGLTSEQLAVIDEICGRYEEHRIAGQNLSIEALVADAQQPLRDLLELELIRVELEITSRWHQQPSLAEIQERFPNSASRITARWSEWSSLFAERHDKSAPDTVSQTQPGDTDPNTPTLPAGEVTTLPENQLTPSNKVQMPRSGNGSKPKSESPASPEQRFHIRRQIAEGGIGIVYAAWDADLLREVALKELKSSFVNRPSVVSRFLVEATITSHLEHPNIVPVYAVGQRADGRHYYAMRLIRGRTMKSVIDELHRNAASTSQPVDFRRHPSERDLLLRFVTVCRAITFAHSRGVIHRDLKPENIMVGDFGETLVVDWGLARLQKSDLLLKRPVHSESPESDTHDSVWTENLTSGVVDSRVHLSNIADIDHDGLVIDDAAPTDAALSDSDSPGRTRAGTIVGTPGYMSPEQSVGQTNEVGPSSDVYSLGATLFCLLTNAIPFEHTGSAADDPAMDAVPSFPAATRISVAAAPAIRKHTSPRSVNLHVPITLDAVCRKAMSQRPADRYATADDMARDIESWLADEPVSVCPETFWQQGRRLFRRYPMLSGGLVGSLLIALLAMMFTIALMQSQNEKLAKAQVNEANAAADARRQTLAAEANAKDAEDQRHRIQQILNAFIIDVERGLANVPGSADVRRRVLTQVLIQLGSLSETIQGSSVASMNTVMALTDLGDVFAQFGSDDTGNRIQLWDKQPSTPLESSEKLYREAMRIVDDRLKARPDDDTFVFQKSNIQLKLAAVYRQSSRTAEALQAATSSADIRDELLKTKPDSLEYALGAASSHDLVGQLHLQERDLAGAKAEFTWAASALGRFATATENVDLRRQLAISASRFGDIASREGDLQTAETHYGEDLQIIKQLAQDFPEDAAIQRDYASSCDRLGNLAQGSGRLEQALDWYGQSRKIREKLQMADPSDFQAHRALFVSCMKMGETRMSLKKADEAKQDFIAADEHARSMAEIDPVNTVGIRFRSFAAERLTDIALAEEDLANALELSIRSLDISQQLAGRDPNDREAARDVLICQTKVAKVLLAMNRTAEALQRYTEALTIADAAYQANPTIEGIQDGIYVRTKIAEAHQQAGDASSAELTVAEAVRRLESIPEQNRSDADSVRRLVNLYTLQGSILITMGKSEEAEARLRQAKTLAQRMIDAGQRAEQMKVDLAEIESLLKQIEVP